MQTNLVFQNKTFKLISDRDSSYVIKRFLEDRGELVFEKVFGEKIGYCLFIEFCSSKSEFSVPIVFFQRIEGNYLLNKIF